MITRPKNLLLLTYEAPQADPQSHSDAQQDPEQGTEQDREQEPARSIGPLRTENSFTNVHASPTSVQLVTSTTGAIIHANGVSAGERAIHGLGQMSDETLQQLLRGPSTAQAAEGEPATTSSSRPPIGGSKGNHRNRG